MIILESRIDVGQGMNIGLGIFDKKNKRRALNKCRAWKICQKNKCRAFNKPRKLENIHRPYKKLQNLINVGPLIKL